MPLAPPRGRGGFAAPLKDAVDANAISVKFIDVTEASGLSRVVLGVNPRTTQSAVDEIANFVFPASQYTKAFAEKHIVQQFTGAAAFLDFDNDGYLDIYVVRGSTIQADSTNRLYHNNGDGTFTDVTEKAGVGDAGMGLNCVIGDYDNDGDIDILVTNWNQTADLLRNEGTPPRPRGGPEVNPLGPPRAGGGQNRWIQIRAVGTKSNRSGIGARIKIVAGGLTQYAEVQSGGSYLSFSDLRVHFGLGGAERVELVELRWPSGLIDTAKGLAVNAQFVATEGKGLEICHQANQQSSK